MYRFILLAVFMLVFSGVNAQELNCTITVNSDKVPGSNKQIFGTLETALNEFVNQKRWTNFEYQQEELIQCNMSLTILEYNGSDMRGHIQIQSSRPVYGSTYLTPVFNFKDDDFSFQYTEFEPLLFNENSFESNLVSIVTFYIYTILGMDADSFALNGGTPYFTKAQDVLVQAQQSGYPGWNQNDGTRTRFTLIDNILSPTYAEFRRSLYSYHILGLDKMVSDKRQAKEAIANAIYGLKSIYDSRPNAFLLRIFMDSKAGEIVDVFSDGPRFDTYKLKEDLLRISPINSGKWNEIK